MPAGLTLETEIKPPCVDFMALAANSFDKFTLSEDNLAVLNTGKGPMWEPCFGIPLDTFAIVFGVRPKFRKTKITAFLN